MHYLYGSKKGVARRLVATFGSEQQLQAYVRWATLESRGERAGKFEQGSVLASYNAWEASAEPLTDEPPVEVNHNPTPQHAVGAAGRCPEPSGTRYYRHTNGPERRPARLAGLA